LPYVGFASGVFRFDPYATSVAASKVDIIGTRAGVPGLPGDGKHPLLALVFDHHGDLFVSLGAASDNCETATGALPDPTQPCTEAEGAQARGVIRKYLMAWPEGRVHSWTTYAFGLRNALALAVHPHSHRLLQGDNARDTIHRRIPGMANDEELPHDELNALRRDTTMGGPTAMMPAVRARNFLAPTASGISRRSSCCPRTQRPWG
jgi:glucose/arabinose dehydrogenase